jgi:hypothetical protein
LSLSTAQISRGKRSRLSSELRKVMMALEEGHQDGALERRCSIDRVVMAWGWREDQLIWV